ncbi:hypothetical protein TorRG33x02_095710, partial [Trema orientale]
EFESLSEPGKRGQGPWSKATRAAFTAKSMSSLSPSATFAITSPFLGSIVSNVFPETESTNSPLTNSFVNFMVGIFMEVPLLSL